MPPAIVLAKLLAVLGAVLRKPRALAGLAMVRQTVRSGAIAGPLRQWSGDPALGTPLLRRDHDLIRVPGCVLLLALTLVRPTTLPAVGIQPVLPTLLFAELSPRQVSLTARAA